MKESNMVRTAFSIRHSVLSSNFGLYFFILIKKKKKRNKQNPHFFRGESFFWFWNLLLLFQFCPCSIFVCFCCTSSFGVPKYSVLLLTLMLITGFFFQHDAIFFIRFLLGFFSEQLHWKQFFSTTRADCWERIVLKAWNYMHGRITKVSCLPRR